MDGNSNEKFADILSEMRIFKCRNLANGKLENCVTTQHYFADRLEAAHKREVEEAVARAVRAMPVRFSGHK